VAKTGDGSHIGLAAVAAGAAVLAGALTAVLLVAKRSRRA
jgi:hypothetical protein